MQTRLMTPEHPEWDDFMDMLVEQLVEDSGLELTDELTIAHITGGCDHTFDKSRAAMMLIEDANIRESLENFKDKGGYCDCEVVLNIQPRENEYKEEEEQ